MSENPDTKKLVLTLSEAAQMMLGNHGVVSVGGATIGTGGELEMHVAPPGHTPLKRPST